MKPLEDKAHTTGRAKMAAISGSPKNFESKADKADRMAYDYGAKKLGKEADVTKKSNNFAKGGRCYDDGGDVQATSDSLPNPFMPPGKPPRKPKPPKPIIPTPLPPNQLSRGGRR